MAYMTIQDGIELAKLRIIEDGIHWGTAFKEFCGLTGEAFSASSPHCYELKHYAIKHKLPYRGPV